MSRCPFLQCELSGARRGTAARLLAALGLSLITTACGPAIARELFPVETWISAPPGPTPSHVEWRDLAQVQDATLDEALMRLRPEWFRFASSAYSASESARVVVYVDDVLTGAPETLRDVPISAVVDVRYLRASAARNRFGSGCRCESGAVVVRTRAGGGRAQ